MMLHVGDQCENIINRVRRILFTICDCCALLSRQYSNDWVEVSVKAQNHFVLLKFDLRLLVSNLVRAGAIAIVDI